MDFGFVDSGLIGSCLVLIITLYEIIGCELNFIDTDYSTIVSRLGLICFGLEPRISLFWMN